MRPAGAETDEQLAASAKSGDRVAFEELVRRHKASIYRFVRRYIGQGDDAYDVLQDCFVATWSGLARFDASRPFLPWLRVIALNKCRDFARRQKVRRLVLKAFALETGTEREDAAPPSPDMEDAEDERLRRLDEAVSRLGPFYKEPLLLTIVSGLSHQEAAALLKTTPKAIEMRLYRARKQLLAELEPQSREG